MWHFVAPMSNHALQCATDDFEFVPRVPCRDDGIWLFRRLFICRLKVTGSEAVPEPSTVILALSGLVAMRLRRRRR